MRIRWNVTAQHPANVRRTASARSVVVSAESWDGGGLGGDKQISAPLLPPPPPDQSDTAPLSRMFLGLACVVLVLQASLQVH